MLQPPRRRSHLDSSSPATSVPDTLTTLRSALAGRYRVERAIGEGGMATVYLAHEERYDRRVAIKVLRPEIAAALGAERFLREIRMTAALQHPHILPLYDSGDAAGLVYYVMPFIEGESLRARLDRQKQLPIRDALDIARSVASALDYAHHRGLIHRDVKPENILLSGDARDGVTGLQALVADFGVAVAAHTVGLDRLTGSGVSIGTPMYMSPEQSSAERHLGPASDVYALGVVLYEMLAGEPPFTGPTAQAVVAKIMTESPVALRGRRATVPVHIDAAILKALEKAPADRFASAAQFADALQSDEHAVVAGGPRPAAGRLPFRVWLPWALTASLAVFAGAMLVRGAARSDPSSSAGPTHLAIAMPQQVSAPLWNNGIATGGHGRLIAFVGSEAGGHSQLYLKRLDEPNVSPLAGTDGATNPVFSPDGAWLAFFTPRGQLKKISLASGAITAVADSVGQGSDAAWTAEGSILFFRNSPGGAGICRIAVNGGATTCLTRVDAARGEALHFSPQALPGGAALIYSVFGMDSAGVFLRVMVRADSGSPARALIEGASFARYIGGGKLVYQRGTNLYVADLDARALRATGERRLISGVTALDARIIPFGAPWALSDDILVYAAASGAANTLVWVDRDGRSQPLVARPELYGGPSISPDGKRAAVAILNGTRSDVWLYDFAQDILTQVSTDGTTIGAIWSPDGQHLTTATKIGTGETILSRRIDGSGAPHTLLHTGHFLWPSAWSRDGARLVVMDHQDISLVDFRKGTALHPVVHTPAVELGGRLSPDERWVAYFSDVTGSAELYVAAFPAGQPRWRVSHGGAREAVWSRDGRELFFRSANGRQMKSVAIRPGATFATDTARVLWSGDYFFYGGPGLVNYDVSLDGKRFLMLQRTGSEGGGLNYVLGWRQLGETRR